MRRHRAERAGLGHGASGDLHAAGPQVLADRVRTEVGDEAQVERAWGVDRTCLPIGRAAGPHVDLLVAEDQCYPVVTEDFAPHPKHQHVPVGGGVDVAAIEHHMVDAVNNKGHAFSYLRFLPVGKAALRESMEQPVHDSDHVS
jgi:hypothetical protein